MHGRRTHCDGPAYVVEHEHSKCSYCGNPDATYWTIVGPDGDAIGESWLGDVGKEHAQAIAELLNDAYLAGMQASPR